MVHVIAHDQIHDANDRKDLLKIILVHWKYSPRSDIKDNFWNIFKVGQEIKEKINKAGLYSFLCQDSESSTFVNLKIYCQECRKYSIKKYLCSWSRVQT